jgi:DNA-binding beta-propeller fold protein YncE
VSGLTTDAQDNVYVFQRNLVPSIIVFAPDGTELRQMGIETFKGYEPHGIWVGPDPSRGGEEVLLTTDRRRQQVLKLTLSGEELAAWGDLGVPGDAGEPFNHPTRATIAPSGDVFVSDGYGQYRVHRLAADGTVIRSWGRKGGGPGEFRWPVHSVAIDPRGRVLIADRGNNRIQLFDVDGNYLDAWGGFKKPQDLCLTPEGDVMIVEGYLPGVSVFSLDGELLCRWGEQGDAPGQFGAGGADPHSLCVDSRGNVYVAEVRADNCLHKFTRIS